jgi:hypothetical protein
VPGPGNSILVPKNGLEQWFDKFVRRFRQDPDFLTRTAEPV